MGSSVAEVESPRQRELPEKAEQMARAHLRKAEKVTDWREQVGKAIERTRALGGLSLKEFAAAVGRDTRQVSRWETGCENPQLHTIFAVKALRQLFVLALAEVAGEGIEIETTVRIRRIG